VIPRRVTRIGAGAFAGCSSLARLTIPATVKEFSQNAFINVTKIALELTGERLLEEVVQNIKPCLAPGATVVSASTADRRFERFTIVAA
jgi:hypothetical protein